MRWRRVVYVALLVLGSMAAPGGPSIETGFALASLRATAQTELSAALGTRVSISRVSVGARGIVLGNVVVHAPKLQGAHRPVLSARRALLVFDWWSLLPGAEAKLDGIELAHVETTLAPPHLALTETTSALSGTNGAPASTEWSRLVARVIDTGVRWCRVSDLRVAAHAGPKGELLQLFGGELALEQHRGRLAVELNAKRLVYDGTDAGSLSAHAIGDASKLEVQRLDLRAPSAVGWARGELRWAQAPASFDLKGGLELESEPLARALHGLDSQLPTGTAVSARRAVAAFDLHGPLGDVKGWSGQGRVMLTRPSVRIPGARSRVNLDRLDLEANYSASGVQLDAMRGHGRGVQLQARLAMQTGASRVLSGSLSLADLDLLRRTLPEHLWPRRLRPRLRSGGRIELTAEVRWTGADARLHGRVQGAGLAVHGAGGAEPILLSQFATRFDAAPTRGSHWLLNDIVLRGPAGVVRGRARLSRGMHHAELAVDRLDALVLSDVLPGSIERGVLRGRFIVDGSAGEPLESLSGRLQVHDVLWRPPAESPSSAAPAGVAGVEIRGGSASVSRFAAGWRFGELVIDGAVRMPGTARGQELRIGAKMRGQVEIGERTHHAALDVEQLEPGPVNAMAAFVPGLFDPGVVRISADIQGSRETPVTQAHGRIQLRNARWVPPIEAELCSNSLAVRRASAEYSWRPGELRFGEIDLEGTEFGARGDVSWRAGATRIDARVTTRNVGKLADLFPELSGLVQGGHGSATVQVSASATGTSGVVEGRIEKGVLAISSVSGVGRTRHPIEKASFGYAFGPRQRRIQGLKIRGPQLNVDLDAKWSEHGRVTGRGRLWLTRHYIDQVTHGAGWALGLLGYRSLNTEFTLSGTRRDVRMDAKIAHGFRWQLLRIAVPDRLEKIGRGEMPVFTAHHSPLAACSR